MYTVIYEPQAEDDLIEIVLYYIEQSGFVLGETIQKRLQAHIALLQTIPYRTIESPLAENVREFLIERLPYKAYFTIDESSKSVFILRILHTSRNHKKEQI